MVFEVLTLAFADALEAIARFVVIENERQRWPLFADVFYEWNGRTPSRVEVIDDVIRVTIHNIYITGTPASAPVLNLPIMAGVRIAQFQDMVRNGNVAVEVER